MQNPFNPEDSLPFLGLHNITRPTQSYPWLQFQAVVYSESLNRIHVVNDSSANPISRRPVLGNNPLSIDEIVRAAEGMKEDLQRKANQGIMRNDLNRALQALSGIGVIDEFVYLLKVRSGSQMGLPVMPAPRRMDARGKRKAAAAGQAFLPKRKIA
jgi:hypothetical protein